jgi:hypothetical protein
MMITIVTLFLFMKVYFPKNKNKNPFIFSINRSSPSAPLSLCSSRRITSLSTEFLPDLAVKSRSLSLSLSPSLRPAVLLSTDFLLDLVGKYLSSESLSRQKISLCRISTETLSLDGYCLSSLSLAGISPKNLSRRISPEVSHFTCKCFVLFYLAGSARTAKNASVFKSYHHLKLELNEDICN